MKMISRNLAIVAATKELIELHKWAYERWGRSAETHAQRVVVGMAFTEDSISAWRKLSAYVLTELRWIERGRPLTAPESHIRTTAERLRVACGPQPSPPGTTYLEQRAWERRQLEEAYNRALFHVNQTIEGEPQ